MFSCSSFRPLLLLSFMHRYAHPMSSRYTLSKLVLCDRWIQTDKAISWIFKLFDSLGSLSSSYLVCILANGYALVHQILYSNFSVKSLWNLILCLWQAPLLSVIPLDRSIVCIDPTFQLFFFGFILISLQNHAFLLQWTLYHDVMKNAKPLRHFENQVDFHQARFIYQEYVLFLLWFRLLKLLYI